MPTMPSITNPGASTPADAPGMAVRDSHSIAPAINTKPMAISTCLRGR